MREHDAQMPGHVKHPRTERATGLVTLSANPYRAKRVKSDVKR
jgi:hypothetical protein